MHANPAIWTISEDHLFSLRHYYSRAWFQFLFLSSDWLISIFQLHSCFAAVATVRFMFTADTRFESHSYLVGKLAIRMNHIFPRSDENTRGDKIFLSDKTWSHVVRCPLYNTLVPGFSVKHFTEVFHFNWCIECCYGWRIWRKWKFPVS